MKPHLLPAGNGYHIQWNLDKSVGKGASNSSREDVTYIQWYYTLAAESPLIDRARAAIYAQVRITGTCTGRDDDPLVKAIIAHQTFLRHPVIDGRVSVAHGNGKVGSNAFFVFRLGARLADMYPNEWPRLDKIKKCPDGVKKAVARCIPRI